MKIFRSIIFVFVIFVISSCNSAKIVADNYPPNTKTSKVKIHREDSILFFAISAILGYDKKDKVSLSRGESSEIIVPIGKHEFFVRSNQFDKPFKTFIEVKENRSSCLIIRPEVAPAIAFGALNFITNSFKIEESNFCK